MMHARLVRSLAIVLLAISAIFAIGCDPSSIRDAGDLAAMLDQARDGQGDAVQGDAVEADPVQADAGGADAESPDDPTAAARLPQVAQPTLDPEQVPGSCSSALFRVQPLPAWFLTIPPVPAGHPHGSSSGIASRRHCSRYWSAARRSCRRQTLMGMYFCNSYNR